MFWSKAIKALKQEYSDRLTENNMKTIDLWVKDYYKKDKAKFEEITNMITEEWGDEKALTAIDYADKMHTIFAKRAIAKLIIIGILSFGVLFLIHKLIGWHYGCLNNAHESGFEDCLTSIRKVCIDNGASRVAIYNDNGNLDSVIAYVATELPENVFDACD